jgi:hypothetical protein
MYVCRQNDGNWRDVTRGGLWIGLGWQRYEMCAKMCSGGVIKELFQYSEPQVKAKCRTGLNWRGQRF